METPRKKQITMIRGNKGIFTPRIVSSDQVERNSDDRIVHEQQEFIHVFCRVKPLSLEDDALCVLLKDSKSIVLTAPEHSLDDKTILQRGTEYIFKHVFDASASQEDVFNIVALPLIENLLKGLNSLLFTYGVTGSGKTYSMTGNIKQRGIMPRCMNTLFNVIADYQAKRCIFKPDHLNGFEILSEDEAMLEREKEINKQLKTNVKTKDSDSDIVSEEACDMTLLGNLINRSNIYAIFITYVEVYNNLVYDLLEDRDTLKPLQSKIIREDASHNMYVHGVTEKEIMSVEEAIEVFKVGQKRKRMAQTNLNAESSRSHSIYNIRLVQAPNNLLKEYIASNKNIITISQLSLVDLAGTERLSRTKNIGLHVREAGNINNSLMTLRTCLEYLKENQQNPNTVPKIVPYRQSRITHLFKNYFEGKGHVSMIVCINSRAEDYDENIQVMKFAELTQEVHIRKDTLMKVNMAFTPNRQTANKTTKNGLNELQQKGHSDTKKSHVDVHMRLTNSVNTVFPEYNMEDKSCIEEMKQFVLQRSKKRKDLRKDLEARCNSFRSYLLQMQKGMMSTNIELASLKDAYKKEQECRTDLENQLRDRKNSIVFLNKKLNSCEQRIEELSRKLRRQQNLLIRKDQEIELEKKKLDSKVASEVEKSNRVHMLHTAKLQDEIRAQNDKFRLLLNILQANDISKYMRRSRSFGDSSIIKKANNNIKESPDDVEQLNKDSATATTTKPINISSPDTHNISTNVGKGLVAANTRHRHSSSISDKWLEHLSPNPIPLGTVLQPHLKKRKSVTKLTDLRVVTNATKYLLASQEADTDGDVETKLFKGNIIPTCGGGAQVIFNDVEHLKQKSPVPTPARKRIISNTDITQINNTKSTTKIMQCATQDIENQTPNRFQV